VEEGGGGGRRGRGRGWLYYWLALVAVHRTYRYR
jgi:hypothetical protein